MIDAWQFHAQAILDELGEETGPDNRLEVAVERLAASARSERARKALTRLRETLDELVAEAGATNEPICAKNRLQACREWLAIVERHALADSRSSTP